MPFDNTSIVAAIWIVMSLVWLGLWTFVDQQGWQPSRAHRVILSGMVAALLGIVAVCGWNGTVLSDDVYRYVWDGWVTVHGEDPYAHVPSSNEYAHLQVTDGTFRFPQDVPYNEVPTIYPPGAQWLFAGISSLTGTTVVMWSAAWALFNLALLIMIATWLRSQTDTWWPLWLVVASPTVLLHGFVDPHVDAVVALLMLGGCVAVQRSQVMLAGMLFGLGISVKYLPVIAVFYVAGQLSWRQRITLLGSIAGVLVVAYVPFVDSALLGNLPVYLSTWQANASVYHLVRLVAEQDTTRWLLLLIGLMVTIVIWRRWRQMPATATALTLIALLLCSPVVHAWYLLPAALLIPLAPLRSTLIWLATMSTYGIVVAHYRSTGTWTEPPWLLVIEYVPVMIGFVVDVVRGPLRLATPTASARAASARPVVHVP